jgi:hypothetical protein
VSRLDGNLLEPLTWDHPAEAGNFIKNHRCWCGAALVLDELYGKYNALCNKHGPVHEHDAIHREAARKMKDNRLSGEYELRKDDPPTRTPEEIIKEITGGF